MSPTPARYTQSRAEDEYEFDADQMIFDALSREIDQHIGLKAAEEDSYVVKKLRALNLWMQDEKHPHHKVARAYCKARDAIRNVGAPPGSNAHGWIQRRLEAAHHALTRAFFSDLKVVFVTNNSSAHDELRKWNAELVWLQDEAGQSSKSDTIVVMGAWLEKIHHATFFGDHKQLTAVVKAATRNEYAPSQSVSLFESLIKSNEVISHTLEITYRMHKYISAWPSRAFYNGVLINDESTRHAPVDASMSRSSP